MDPSFLENSKIRFPILHLLYDLLLGTTNLIHTNFAEVTIDSEVYAGTNIQ